MKGTSLGAGSLESVSYNRGKLLPLVSLLYSHSLGYVSYNKGKLYKEGR